MHTGTRQHMLLPILIASTLLCCGCHDNDRIVSDDSITGSGRIVSENRAPGTFSGIRVTGVAKVFVSQDTAESLRIEADDNIVDRVMTSVNGGVLLVGLKDGSYHNVTVNTYATMRTVNLLEVAGTADFRTTGPIQTAEITCRINGTGTITLEGTATQQTVEIIGAGDVRNFSLISARCSASISGTGNIEVNVTQELDAFVTGVGTITYTGNPAVVHQTVTGVGSVHPAP